MLTKQISPNQGNMDLGSLKGETMKQLLRRLINLLRSCSFG